MRHPMLRSVTLLALLGLAAAARAETPVRGPDEVEAALAEFTAAALATPESEARDELRLHLARLRLGMVEGCKAHPRVPGYPPAVPGYACQALNAPSAAALDAREIRAREGSVVTPADELRFLVGTCLRPPVHGYGTPSHVQFDLLDENCAIVAQDLAPSALVGLNDSETSELAALLRDAAAAYAGRPTRFQNAGSAWHDPYNGTTIVTDLARRLQLARDRRAAWDRQLPLARPVLERLVAWRDRAERAKGPLQLEADDRGFCREIVVPAVADRLTALNARTVSDLERAMQEGLTLRWSLKARALCSRAGAFRDGELVPLADGITPLAGMGRRDATKDLSRPIFKVAPSAKAYGVVHRVSPSEAGFVVAFASVTDTREVLVGCVDSDKFDRVERVGSTYTVRYQRTCRVGGVNRTVYGTAPVIVDEALAKVMKPGMVLVVGDDLDFGVIAENGRPTQKTFEPVRTTVEWLLPRGTQIDPSGNVPDTVVPIAAWGTPLAPRKR